VVPSNRSASPSSGGFDTTLYTATGTPGPSATKNSHSGNADDRRARGAVLMGCLTSGDDEVLDWPTTACRELGRCCSLSYKYIYDCSNDYRLRVCSPCDSHGRSSSLLCGRPQNASEPGDVIRDVYGRNLSHARDVSCLDGRDRCPNRDAVFLVFVILANISAPLTDHGNRDAHLADSSA
jgi:hypothetical protein